MKFVFRDLILAVPEFVYYPEEDSLLFADVITHLSLQNKNVLDVGTGSGFLAILCAKQGAVVTAVDINPVAVQAAQENAKKNYVSIHALQSDLCDRISGSFDILLFNAPYLPTDDHPADQDARWSGGSTGRDAIERFIIQASRVLSPHGRIFLLISSLTGTEEVIGIFTQHHFRSSIIAQTKVPWEELLVVEATPE